MKTKTNLFKVFIIAGIGFCLLMALPAWSETFYVDVVNGSDENDGLSSSTAWGTLHFAVLQLNGLDEAEHVLNVLPGTYSVGNNENPEVNEPLTLTRSGVTIQGAAGVIIDGNNECGGWWDGFTVNAADVVLRDLEIKQFTCEGNAGVNVQSGSNTRIESCDLNNNDYGIVFSSGLDTDHVVESCEIHSNGSGIIIKGFSPQILRNTIYGNGNGINISYSGGQTIRPKIINNLIYGMPDGIMDQGIWASAYSTNSTIAAVIHHNTIAGGQSKGIYIAQENPNTAETFDVRFNIITNFSVGIEENVLTSSILAADYNDVVNNSLYDYNSVTPGPHDISLDPLFVDAAGFDFHLQPASPAVNAIPPAANDPTLYDLDGILRPQGSGFDMGCYETMEEVEDWTTTTSLSVNRMLSVAAAPGNGYVYIINGYVDSSAASVGNADGRSFYALQNANGALGPWQETTAAIPGNFTRAAAGVAQYNGKIYLAGGAVDSPSWDGSVWYTTPGVSGDITAWTQATNSIPNWIGSWPYMAAYNGYLYVGGGYRAGGVFSDRCYAAPINPDGSPGTWTQTTTLPATSVRGQLLFHNSRAYLLAGDDDEIYMADVAPSGAIGAWSQIGVMPGGVSYPAAEIIGGVIYVVQGGSTNVYTSSIQADGSLGTWVLESTLPEGVTPWEQGVYHNGYFYLIGDQTDSENLTRVYMHEISGTPATQYTLTVNTVGQGSVTLDPPGGICNAGTVVSLTAVPASGWKFSGWSGDLSGTGNPTTITMDADKTVTATFVENSPPDPPVIEDPPDEKIFGELETIKLTTGTYHDPEGDEHVETLWKVWRADSGEFVSGYPLVSEQDLTVHEIAVPLDAGLKYEWQVEYKDAAGKTSPSAIYSFKVGTSEEENLPGITAGTTVVDFGMISIVHWPDDPSPEKVFNIKYDPRYYRIGTYDPITGVYLEIDDGLEVEPGRSYWMLAREGLAVNFNGIPVSKIHDIEVCLHHGADGWNMIAPPNDANYAWGEILVGVWNEETEEFISPAPISTLTDDTIIDRRVWEWQAGAYVSHLPEDDFLLERYKGYWVKAKVDGVYLVFLIPAQTGQIQSSRAVASSRARGTAAEDGDSPPMPIGELTENKTQNILGGCFIETLKK